MTKWVLVWCGRTISDIPCDVSENWSFLDNKEKFIIFYWELLFIYWFIFSPGRRVVFISLFLLSRVTLSWSILRRCLGNKVKLKCQLVGLTFGKSIWFFYFWRYSLYNNIIHCISKDKFYTFLEKYCIRLMIGVVKIPDLSNLVYLVCLKFRKFNNFN